MTDDKIASIHPVHTDLPLSQHVSHGASAHKKRNYPVAISLSLVACSKIECRDERVRRIGDERIGDERIEDERIGDERIGDERIEDERIGDERIGDEKARRQGYDGLLQRKERRRE